MQKKQGERRIDPLRGGVLIVVFDALELLSEHGSFSGVQRFYRHASREIGLRMGFSHVESSPLTRSSYHAWDQVRSARAQTEPSESLLANAPESF